MENRLKIIVDADDVLLSCNRHALDLLLRDKGIDCSMDDIHGWGMLGSAADERLRYFDDPVFFATQPMMEHADIFLKQLMEVADVTIMTAVNPRFAGARIQRLQELFPFFPVSKIILGERKDMIQADIILDDRVKNVMLSSCRLPVLFRQPWNRKVSGLCAVQNYQEFISIVQYIRWKGCRLETKPGIICIVGPAGTNKHSLQSELVDDDSMFEPVVHVTTAESFQAGSMHISETEFSDLEKRGLLAENTWYDNARYGTIADDFSQILAKGKTAVSIMDMSGCISMTRRYPGRCLIVYADRSKYGAVSDILESDWLTKKQMTDRICNFDLEQKNQVLADLVVSTEDGDIARSADKIRSYFK